MTAEDDARRDAQGLPAVDKKKSSTVGRLINAALLGFLGLSLVTQGTGIVLALGVLVLGGAAYQLLAAAIAQGVKDGKS